MRRTNTLVQHRPRQTKHHLLPSGPQIISEKKNMSVAIYTAATLEKLNGDAFAS